MTAHAIEQMPAASREEDVVIDTYHGVQVADPFRWLEDAQSPRTHEWIDAQAAATRRYLDSLPRRDRNISRVTELLDRQNIVEIRKSGAFVYSIRRDPGDEQAKLYRREGVRGPDQLLLDPAALGEGSSLSLTILDISPDEKLLAYGLRTGGQGPRRVRILNVETGETLPDELPKGALRGFSFMAESKGFIYSLEDAAKPDDPKIAKRHFLNHAFETDKTLFYGGRGSGVRLLSGIDPCSSLAIHTVFRAKRGKNSTSVHLQRLNDCGVPILTFAENLNGTVDVRVQDNEIYLFTDPENDNVRQLLRVSLNAPDLEQARTILREDDRYIQSWHVFGNHILVVRVENISSALCLYTTGGAVRKTIDLPGLGTTRVLSGDRDGFFFGLESCSQPEEVYYYDFETDEYALFGPPAAKLDHIVLRRTEYVSHDGTRIPLTLVGREEVLDTGHAPVILTGYGASGVCLTPQFSPLAARFAELGGVFAIAHIRGGGELGRAWHEAGRGRNRPVVNTDFLCAAEFLFTAGIAHRQRLAIAGGSNSGLLVATAMTLRPDLFRAVMCIAPIIDMVRYQALEATQFCVPQYGSPDNPDDFQVLLSYSPYQNVREGVRYPALLMISGANDTRCDPFHASKFVARVQAAVAGLPEDERNDQPVLLEWNPLRGHFPTLPLAVRAAGIVDRLAFLCHHLEMEIV